MLVEYAKDNYQWSPDARLSIIDLHDPVPLTSNSHFIDFVSL